MLNDILVFSLHSSLCRVRIKSPPLLSKSSSLDTSSDHQNFAHETLQQLVLIVPLYVLIFDGYERNSFDLLEHRCCYVQLWNNIFHL